MTAAVQLPLFGVQSVHVGRYASPRTCVMCKVLLALAEVFDPCGTCPGFVEPAPSWAVLGGSGALAEPLPFVAASLEAA